MVDSKASKVVIRISDLEGIIRAKTDGPFSAIIAKVAARMRMEPDSLLNNYEAHCMDEGDKSWVFDEESYQESIEFAEGDKFELFFTRIGANEAAKQTEPDNAMN